MRFGWQYHYDVKYVPFEDTDWEADRLTQHENGNITPNQL